MLGVLKRLLAGKELRALERYRAACHLVYRWNGNKPNSAETAEWIMQVGEDLRGTDIEQFRERLRPGAAAEGITIEFPCVGAAGPFPVVDGVVKLPDVTMNNLIHRARIGYVLAPEAVVDGATR